MQVLLALADPLDAGEHTGVRPVHDDTAGPPLLPGPGGRTAGRAIAAARRAGSAGGDLGAVLRAALTDPRNAAPLASSARADAAMLRKLGFGLTAGRNLLQGPLVPGKQRAWTRPVPVEAVRAGAAGSTVNDLMLTAITSALRRYLLEHAAPAEEVIVIVPANLRPAGAPLSGLLDQLGYQQADVLGMSGGGDGPGRSLRSAGGRTRGRTGCRAPRAQQRRQRGQMVKDHRRRRAADARYVEPDDFVLRAERVDERLQRPIPQINVKLLHHPLTNVPLC